MSDGIPQGLSMFNTKEQDNMAANNNDPHYVTIPEWVKRTGISRAKTYELLAEQALQSRKVGARTLLDFTAGLSWIAARPAAKIRLRFKNKVNSQKPK
jgi:predicted DNA-binding transcriptional regulator AlpA